MLLKNVCTQKLSLTRVLNKWHENSCFSQQSNKFLSSLSIRFIKHKTCLFYHVLRTLFHLITWVISFQNTLIPYQQAWQGQTTICAKIGLHLYFYTHQIPFISKQGTAQRQNEYYGFILPGNGIFLVSDISCHLTFLL